MNTTLKRIALAITGAGLLTIYGCGGGGGSAVSPPVVPSTVDVSVTVVDGPIKNATVCLDINTSGTCDSGEPSGRTDVDGKVILSVAVADAGNYLVLAVVGLDAIDADTGAVPVPFTMSAPADRVGVVSPLTTLVQQTIASTGANTADAAASVQAATGITVSLFQDFTKVAAPTDGSISAATVARMVVVTTQQQATVIASTLGTATVDGASITQADLNNAIQKKLLELLPALVTAISDPTVQAAATPAARESLLLAAANTLVTGSGLTSASIATVVAINNQASSGTPVALEALRAGFTLNNLNYTNASNYFARVFTASLAQNTPDASGNVRYVERRYRSNTGNLAKWGAGSEPARQADLHWNGSAWVSCALNSENTSGVRDAQGNSTFNYCDNLETGKSSRATFGIAGKTMLEVYTQVRAAGYTNLTVADTTALGSATFPTGSLLFYQTSTPLTAAIAYYPGSSHPAGVSNVVSQFSPAVAAGGVASAQGAGVGCNAAEFQNTNGSNSTTLEGMIGAMTGTPCIYGLPGSFGYNGTTYTNQDTVNEAWGNSTVGIGTIGSAAVGTGATAPGFYSGNTKLRLAFKGTGSNPVTYYACKERFNNGSTRNCTVIGTGSYAIATLGDARVMTLNNLPAQASVLNYTRVFVERAGLVYAGYRNKPNVGNSARLNAIGATALLGQLSVPIEDPSVPLALTAGSYQGTWDLRDPADLDEGGLTLVIKANGSFTCQDRNDLSFFPCTLTFTNAAVGAFTLTDDVGGPSSTETGTFNFMTGIASGTFNDPSSTPAHGIFVGQRR